VLQKDADDNNILKIVIKSSRLGSKRTT
jgi:hypothetical protein